MANDGVDQVITRSGAAFGTSGVRGLVADLDDATVVAYTTAFLDFLGLQTDAKIWVGHDLRPSSPGIAAAALAAIEAASHRAVFCGEIPTPALAFAALKEGEAAIMVTGSHIPFDRNGIKFYRPDGELMKADEALILGSEAVMPNVEIQPCPRVDPLAHQQWERRNLDAFDGVLEGLRVGHYQHSAAGRDLLAGLLEKLGADVVVLGRSDTFVPVDTEAVAEEDRIQAQAWTQKYGLDALITTDGDGDRPLLADETGTYFRGDALGILAGLALGVETMVTPVSSTSAVEGSGFFSTVVRTKIGSPHVLAVMTQGQGSVAGFEANGGFMTASRLAGSTGNLAPLPTRDALLPVLAVLSLARKRGVKLSELPALLPQRMTMSDRLEAVPTEDSSQWLANLRQDGEAQVALHPANLQVAGLDETDGLRITYQNGDIVHARPSGNAPELRIYVEGDSAGNAQILLNHALARAAREFGRSGGIAEDL